MKTKEFIEKVEDLGFSVEENYKQLVVKNENGRTVMTTEMSSWGNINTNYPDFKYMEDFEGFDTRWRLLEAAFEYVFTLVEEREEPKKYHLILKNDGNILSDAQHLNKYNGTFLFNSEVEGKYHQTKFTQEEIDNFPEDIKALMCVLEQVEVDSNNERAMLDECEESF